MNTTKEQHISVLLPAGGTLVVEVESPAQEQTERLSSGFVTALTENLSPDGLRDWRKNKKLTQAKLANLLRVRVAAVASWEQGVYPVPPYLWLALVGLDALEAGNSIRDR